MRKKKRREFGEDEEEDKEDDEEQSEEAIGRKGKECEKEMVFISVVCSGLVPVYSIHHSCHCESTKQDDKMYVLYRSRPTFHHP